MTDHYEDHEVIIGIAPDGSAIRGDAREHPCLSCTRNAGWHRRQAVYLEETYGPHAALEFEQQHLEADL